MTTLEPNEAQRLAMEACRLLCAAAVVGESPDKLLCPPAFMPAARAAMLALRAASLPAQPAAPVLAPAGVQQAQEREAFEQTMRGQGWTVQLEANGEYSTTYVRGAWKGWLARAAYQSAGAPLNDAQILELFADYDECKTSRDGLNFARAVLRAAGAPDHG